MASKIVLDKKTIARLEISNLKLKESKLLEKRNVSVLKSNSEENPKQEINDEGIITYVITSPYNLDCGEESFSLAKNSVLKFEGDGKILNGTVIGDNSTIIADNKVFDNVNVKGTWKCVGNVAWFADATDLETFNCSSAEDKSSDIQKALDSSFRELVFPPVAYYISNTLVLKKEKKLVFQGSEMFQSLDQKIGGHFLSTSENTSILFTCENITILQMAISEETIEEYHKNCVVIEGGNFDVSLCTGYTKNCVEAVSNNKEKIWGLTINGTTIKGKALDYDKDSDGHLNQDRFDSVGININPYKDTVTTSNAGYITNVRINARIYSFGIGVKVTSHPKNWCSDIVVDGNILFCPQAVVSDISIDVRASIQAGRFFYCGDEEIRNRISSEKDWDDNDKDWKELALIEISEDSNKQLDSSISSPIIDCRLSGDSSGTLRIANCYEVEIKSTSKGVVAPYGYYLAHYAFSTIKGHVLYDDYIPSLVKNYEDGITNGLLFPLLERFVTLQTKYNVTSITNETKLFNNNNGTINSIEIDGFELLTTPSAYTFSTTGEHIVKYKLKTTKIIDYMFDGEHPCHDLTSVIAYGVKSIGNSAFYGCTNLTSVTIDSGVTSIGNSAFYGCTNLTSVYIYATIPPTLGNNYVFNSTNDCPIYVPSSSVDAYKSAPNWSTYASRIQAMPNSQQL